MTEGFDKVVAKLNELLVQMGKVPSALAAIQPIPAPWANWGNPPDIPNGDGSGAFAAAGGLVTGSGVRYLAGGGRVLRWPSQGTDTVPAMLTEGEGVITRKGMAGLGPGGLAAINSGQGLGGGNVSVDLSGLQDEVAGLRQDLADSQQQLPKLVRDAVLLAPSRRVA
jgi:hypothetical protein